MFYEERNTFNMFVSLNANVKLQRGIFQDVAIKEMS